MLHVDEKDILNSVDLIVRVTGADILSAESHFSVLGPYQYIIFFQALTFQAPNWELDYWDFELGAGTGN